MTTASLISHMLRFTSEAYSVIDAKDERNVCNVELSSTTV